MTGSYALDTNIAIAFLKREELVTKRLRVLERPLVPAPVVAELLYGAYRSQSVGQNLSGVYDLVGVGEFVACNLMVCEQHARLKALLANAGRPIPVNDLWIAACCLATDATLVTRDGHFDAVPGLKIERW